VTENIAIDGFFCYCRYPFSPGDRLKFLLLLPATDDHSRTGTGMYLCGHVEVVRVTVDGSQRGSGIGCRITGYSVLPDSDSLSLEQAFTEMIGMEATQS
jgi:hypothetical protein